MARTSYQFDTIIIGAGGAGMRAALQLAHSGLKVALLSKVFPSRSHTVSAQGGITCALGNADPEDDWRWHMYDTVKGSDYLGDQDAIEYMCMTGPEAVYELEHMGLPFSRMDNGKIYQRPFGGQSKNYGGEQAARTCAAADRTGHALLHTLYQQNLKHGTQFFNEWFAIDLVKTSDGKGIAGAMAMDMATGETAYFNARMTILATGGAGRIFQSTTNALINTGDGMGMVLRAGFPLQDMEMWQFHPTGIAGAGVLVTEGCRGEGGYLINKNGERFMERYAPNAKDLASRDVVSRAIALEIRAGNAFVTHGVEHVKLKLDHLGADLIKSRLPGIRELSMTFAGVDPIAEPIPVVPTCHYIMGGIPTNVHGQVVTTQGGQDSIVSGLYAVGECACVSVHGANRLGGNSLLDLIVFGRAAGLHVEEAFKSGLGMPVAADDDVNAAMARFNRWEKSTAGERPEDLRAEMQKIMQQDFGVFRTAEYMTQGLKKIAVLQERLQHALLSDKSHVFNTARIEALELDNLMAVAHATAVTANHRTESRGAHSREDFPERDDAQWLKHLLYYTDEHKIVDRAVNMKPRTVDTLQPKKRTY
ncbi:MAG: sdhA [Gammaproteobacteria bacterium]|jgi:succinate dehydrogenase / fumarate reductase flavoprotein subunit|nr:sdhA [Gammaproteobacteria bacterium]